MILRNLTFQDFLYKNDIKSIDIIANLAILLTRCGCPVSRLPLLDFALFWEAVNRDYPHGKLSGWINECNDV